MNNHQYLSDFYDFGTIRKRLKRASKWYQNHKNPIHIDDYSFDVDWNQQSECYRTLPVDSNQHRMNVDEVILN